MTIGHIKIREALKKIWPNSKAWNARVDKMTDSQAVAVYFRMFKEGKIK
jgi:hypothetical protein